MSTLQSGSVQFRGLAGQYDFRTELLRSQLGPAAIFGIGTVDAGCEAFTLDRVTVSGSRLGRPESKARGRVIGHQGGAIS
jgi:hypothetical protein